MAFEIFDDNAFYCFLFSVLTLTLLPFSLRKLLKSDFSLNVSGDSSSTCLCSKCKNATKIKPPLRMFFYFKKIIFVALWILYIKIIFSINTSSLMGFGNFDPHSILELDNNATKSEIKKRYYSLSLRLHPDKVGKGNAELEKQYLLIKKAYQALTDPVSMENFQKHGHPDGHQGISLTIGLPSFLTAPENESVVLFVYLCLMGGIVLAAILSLRHFSNFSSSGVYSETEKSLIMKIKEDVEPKRFIEILSLSKEFQKFGSVSVKNYAEMFLNAKKNIRIESNYHDYINFTWTVLVHHFYNISLPKNFEENRNDIISTVLGLIKVQTKALSEQKTWIAKMYLRYKDDPKLNKKLSSAQVPLKPILSLLAFSQNLCQRLSFPTDELMQIPHVGMEAAKKIKKNKIYSLKEFSETFSIPESDIGGSLKEQTSSNKKTARVEEILLKSAGKDGVKDINHFLDAVPSMKINAVAQSMVPGKDKTFEIEEGKKVVFSVEVEREKRRGVLLHSNEEIKETKAFRCNQKTLINKIKAHCPNLPYEKLEKWALIAYDETNRNVVGMEWLSFKAVKGGNGFGLKAKTEVALLVSPGAKTRRMVFYVVSDCYSGLDFRSDVEFSVSKKEETNKNVFAVDAEEASPSELNEKDPSPFDLSWVDAVVLVVAVIVFIFVFPETEYGKKVIRNLKESFDDLKKRIIS